MKTIQQLKKTAQNLSTRSKKFKQDVHDFLCDMAVYGQTHDATGGDVLLKFYLGCGGIGSQQKIKAWVEAHTMWKAVKKGDTLTFKKAKGQEWKVEEGRANPWYEFSKEGDDDTKEIDLKKLLGMVHGLASRIEKQRQEGKLKVTDSVVEFDQVLSQIKAINAPQVEGTA